MRSYFTTEEVVELAQRVGDISPWARDEENSKTTEQKVKALNPSKTLFRLVYQTDGDRVDIRLADGGLMVIKCFDGWYTYFYLKGEYDVRKVGNWFHLKN